MPGSAALDRAPDWVADGTPGPLRSELARVLGADRVLTQALDLVAYASDVSPYRLIPKAIAMPHDVDDVSRCWAGLGAVGPYWCSVPGALR